MGNIEEFFEPAKKLCLSETELSTCRKRMMDEMQKKPVRAGETPCLTDDMTDFDPRLITSAQTVRLSTEESERAATILRAFMKDHPVNMAAAIRNHEKKERPSLWRSFFAFRSTPSFAAVLLLVLGGGSLSYAAESALPGDPLYAVKVHVNEEVHAAFSLSTEAKANWEAKRAERRVKEAKQLANAGKLTPEKTTVLVAAFNTHIAAAHTRIQVMADRGDQEKAERVGKKTEKALREEAATIDDTEGDIALILKNVQRATDDTVALDSSINGAIAMNAGTAPMMMQGNADASSADASGSSQSRTDSDHSTEKSSLDKDKKINEHMRIEKSDGPIVAFQTSGILNMKKTKKEKDESSSFSSSGCGSSALSIKSTSSSSLHFSSASDTPVTVEIKNDGSIDINMDGIPQTEVPAKENTIKW